MTRAQRTFHAWIWTLLGPLILIGLTAALLGRPPQIADSAGEPPMIRGASAAPEVVP